MKIYTRTGDLGTTGLFGAERVDKDHPRLEAYGTVDETNSVVGAASALLSSNSAILSEVLEGLQADLFVVGADLATPPGARAVVPRVGADHVSRLEHLIDRYDADLPPLSNFILPGGSPAGAMLHVARTVCRRAERATVALAKNEMVDTQVVIYLNRLSDLLFVLARWVNHTTQTEEVAWKPK